LAFSEGRTPVVLEFKAEGHAVQHGKDVNLICAAFTMLVKSFAGVMETRKDYWELLQADAPGQFYFRADIHICNGNLWYQGVSDMLMRGVMDLAHDFPDQLNIEIRGENYGT